MKAGKIDLDYLARFTNAPCAGERRPNPPNTACSCATRTASRWSSTAHRQAGAVGTPGVKPDLSGTHRASGVTHRPVFHMMADRYLSDDYAPEAVAERCGIPAERIRAIAAELARVAFDEAIELDQPWTDFRGEKHDKMMGRPVVLPRDARDFGALQRLPDLPRAALSADPAWHGRGARRLPLQTALPQTRDSPPQAARQASPRAAA